MSIRRKTNQRITKIKLDKVLSLLNKAEKMTPEQGTTIVSTMDELIPYPEYSNLRFWTRDNILKGINGAAMMASSVMSENYSTDETKGFTISYNVILDGLVLSVPEYKTVTLYNDSEGKPVYELAPKPGLQLSNPFKTLPYTPSKNQETIDTFYEAASSTASFSSTYKTYLPTVIGSSPGTVCCQGLLWQRLEIDLQAIKYQYCIQPNTSYFTEANLYDSSNANSYPQDTLNTPAKQWAWLTGTSYDNSNYYYRYTPLQILYCNATEELALNGKTQQQGNFISAVTGVYSSMPTDFKRVDDNIYNVARLNYTNKVYGTIVHTQG